MKAVYDGTWWTVVHDDLVDGLMLEHADGRLAEVGYGTEGLIVDPTDGELMDVGYFDHLFTGKRDPAVVDMKADAAGKYSKDETSVRKRRGKHATRHT